MAGNVIELIWYSVELAKWQGKVEKLEKEMSAKSNGTGKPYLFRYHVLPTIYIKVSSTFSMMMDRSKSKQDLASLTAENKNLTRLLAQNAKEHQEQVSSLPLPLPSVCCVMLV